MRANAGIGLGIARIDPIGPGRVDEKENQMKMMMQNNRLLNKNGLTFERSINAVSMNV